jgi:hypothetical protein
VELKVEIGFEELLSAIKQLPDSQLAILKQELAKKRETPIKNSKLKALLLNGPVMTDEQYKAFKETRKQLNQWRTK